MNYLLKYILTGTLLLQFALTPLLAENWKDYSKVENITHEIGANGKVNIENKYGTITVSTWDKETASIEATITVSAPNEAKADEVFERIDVDFITGSDYLKAVTEREEIRRGGWQQWLPWNWDYSRGYHNDDLSYKVNYLVQVPATTKLHIINKHGNIVLPDMKEDAVIELGYGDLTAANIEGDVDLHLKHGNAIFVGIDNLNATIRYAKLKLENANDIDLESRYSKISIEQADELKTSSRYDKYSIGSLQKLDNEGRYDDYEVAEAKDADITTKYSDFTFGKILEELEAEMSYGKLTVNQLLPGFDRIDLDGSYTNFHLKTSDTDGYDLDVNTEYTGIKAKDNRISYADVQKDNNHTTIDTKVGNKGDSRIKVNARYGSLTLE